MYFVLLKMQILDPLPYYEYQSPPTSAAFAYSRKASAALVYQCKGRRSAATDDTRLAEVCY